jgi:hypothetical protein
VVLSLFSQLMVVPTGTVSGFGPNALVVKVDAPLAIVTVVLPAGAGVGPLEGVDGALYPPHAARQSVSIRAETTRIFIPILRNIVTALKSPRVARPPGNLLDGPIAGDDGQQTAEAFTSKQLWKLSPLTDTSDVMRRKSNGSCSVVSEFAAPMTLLVTSTVLECVRREWRGVARGKQGDDHGLEEPASRRRLQQRYGIRVEALGDRQVRKGNLAGAATRRRTQRVDRTERSSGWL